MPRPKHLFDADTYTTWIEVPELYLVVNAGQVRYVSETPEQLMEGIPPGGNDIRFMLKGGQAWKLIATKEEESK